MVKGNRGQEFESNRYPTDIPFAAKTAVHCRRCESCDGIVFAIAKKVERCRACRGEEFD